MNKKQQMLGIPGNIKFELFCSRPKGRDDYLCSGWEKMRKKELKDKDPFNFCRRTCWWSRTRLIK